VDGDSAGTRKGSPWNLNYSTDSPSYPDPLQPVIVGSLYFYLKLNLLLQTSYFAGLTCTCIKFPKALMLWMRIWVPVFGFTTLP
jgi:hypothetical protein